MADQVEGALLPGKTAKDNWLALDFARLLLLIEVGHRGEVASKKPNPSETASVPLF